jgi:hypothetical protein
MTTLFTAILGVPLPTVAEVSVNAPRPVSLATKLKHYPRGYVSAPQTLEHLIDR